MLLELPYDILPRMRGALVRLQHQLHHHDATMAGVRGEGVEREGLVRAIAAVAEVVIALGEPDRHRRESTSVEKTSFLKGPIGGVVIHDGQVVVKVTELVPDKPVAWTEEMLRRTLDWTLGSARVREQGP